jgi:hypothetical protein
MITKRDFLPEGDRYIFDFNICTAGKGWAQFDTQQDAAYYGNWVNPTSLEIMAYIEGDVVRHQCENGAEFAAEIRRMSAWHMENDGKPGRIDDMMNEGIRAALLALGLADLMHAAPAEEGGL